MKTLEADIISKGNVIGRTSYVEYETIEEAISECPHDVILKAVNSFVKQTKINKCRAEKTRKVDPIKELKMRAKDNPELQARITQLLEETNTIQ